MVIVFMPSFIHDKYTKYQNREKMIILLVNHNTELTQHIMDFGKLNFQCNSKENDKIWQEQNVRFTKHISEFNMNLAKLSNDINY